uniref:Tail protein n=1 Tax=viral metagenome TaxID=1070528 RepID=A0A6M3M7D6_9ZZZZ
MTDTTCTIGGNVVSNYVVDSDVQKNKVNNIGTCKIRLANPADIWGGTFASNDAIALAINGAPIFAGKVKDVVPYLTEKGVYTNELLITGTDYGRYGADLYFTKKYKTQPGGAILLDIFSMFGGANDPWTYADPGGTPSIKYEGKRTFLCDAVREICDLMAYDSYIDNANELHIFASGTIDSTVDLISLVGDPTNNLLSFDEFEQEGGDIRNIIEISAGNVKDHYTEENPTGWTAGGGGAIASETTTHFIYGLGSIELTCTGASSAYLNFAGTLYGYTGSIDLSPFCQAKVLIKGERDAEDRFNFRPFLVDDGGKEIIFIRRKSGAGSKGITEDIPDWNIGAGKWSVITYPLGDHDGNPIRAAGAEMNGYWTFAAGSVAPFNWNNVVQMGFKYPHAENGIVWIDGWTIPSLEAKYTTADAGSRGLYDDRMYPEYRNELRSMPQLKAYGDRVLLMKRYPLVKFKAVARGQVGTLYAAQYVHVRAPQHGVAALTKYIIVRLQHILRKKSDVRGFDFWTTYDLVSTDADAGRVIRSTDPNAAMLAELRRQNRGFKGSMDDWDLFLGDIETGTRIGFTEGVAFPTDPADEDIHFLTGDVAVPAVHYGAPSGILYRWNETAVAWERGPMYLGRRAADPPVGGEITGDTYFNTTSNTTLQWTGAAWSQVSSLNLADTPDFATVEWPTDQLAIEMRPWTGNFSLVWDDRDDEPPADWNHFLWGLKDNENAADATIHYADGTSIDVNFGQDLNVADGEWFVYWDEAQKTGGDYDVQWTQVYSTASGVGKGLLAVVQVRNATSESPSVMLYNTYIPQMGVGSLVAHSLYSKHFSADWITGKNFQTALNVGTGVAGIRIDSVSIRGYDDVNPGNLQFYLQAADGKAYCGAGAVILDANGITIDGQAIYFRDAGSVFRGWAYGIGGANPYLQLAAAEDLLLTSGAGDDIYIIPGGGATITYMTGWVLPDKVDVQDNLRIPRVANAAAEAAMALANGDLWLRTDL